MRRSCRSVLLLKRIDTECFCKSAAPYAGVGVMSPSVVIQKTREAQVEIRSRRAFMSSLFELQQGHTEAHCVHAAKDYRPYGKDILYLEPNAAIMKQSGARERNNSETICLTVCFGHKDVLMYMYRCRKARKASKMTSV